jgi:hypothetical protein
MGSVLSRAGAGALIALLAGCIHPRAAGVKEIRSFPEYGGVLPISEDGDARADLVLPIEDPGGLPDYRLPVDGEEARARIERTRDRGDELATAVLSPLYLLAGSSLGFLLTLPAMALSARDRTAAEQAQLEQLGRACGVPIEIRVADEAGAGLAGARVLELSAPIEYPTFLDPAGLRSFGLPGLHAHVPSPSLLEALTRHLPVPIGERLRLGDSLNAPALRLGSEDPAPSVHHGDPGGRVAYTSLAPARFIGLGPDGALHEVRPAEPLLLHHIVWAPGHEPVLVTSSGVLAGAPLALAVRLKPIADGARIHAAFLELEQVPARVARAMRLEGEPTSVGITSMPRWVFDTQGLGALVAQLAAQAEDSTLPGYVRWNAYHLLKPLCEALERHCRSSFAPPLGSKARETEQLASRASATLASLAASPPGTRFLADGESNPWRWELELQDWYAIPARVRRERQGFPLASHAASARDLLRRGEALEPGLPDLESLRAVIALAQGERERAVQLSRFLDHATYFAVFHDGMRIVPP